MVVKEQNKVYYREKCKELISQAANDSFCRAAANLMLNSDIDYLQDLKVEFQE